MAAIKGHLIWSTLGLLCLLTLAGPYLHLEPVFAYSLLASALIHIVCIVWAKPKLRPMFIWYEIAPILFCILSLLYHAMNSGEMTWESMSVLLSFVSSSFVTSLGFLHLLAFLGLLLLSSTLFAVFASLLVRKEKPSMELLIQCAYASSTLAPAIDYYVIQQPLTTMAVFRPDEAKAFIFAATLAPLTDALTVFGMMFVLVTFWRRSFSGPPSPRKDRRSSPTKNSQSSTTASAG